MSTPPSNTAAASGHLTQPGDPHLILAQSDPIAPTSAGDLCSGCAATHSHSNQSNRSLDTGSAHGISAAFADDSTNGDASALYHAFA